MLLLRDPIVARMGRIQRVVDRVYRHLGSRYHRFVLAVQATSAGLIAMVSVAFLSVYYQPPLGDVVAVIVLSGALSVLATMVSFVRGRGNRRLVVAWRDDTVRTPADTVAAWDVAASLTLHQYRRNWPLVNLTVIVPTCAVAADLWGIGLGGFGAMLLAGVLPGLYATVLGYSVSEILLRPVVAEIAAELPAEFDFTAYGMPVAKRLLFTVPIYITVAGVAVAGLLDGGGGSRRLVLAVLVSLGVGLFFSLEVTSLLTASITRPIAAVRTQLERVRGGDYTAHTLVLSGDELGELAHDANVMTAGLAEREQVRAAFGTYVDSQVADLILSGDLPAEGVEIEVSVLFCDVRGFTSYAERVAASEVVSTLNQLFAETVPVVEAYGGHVDKFLGDGFLAVFGAPRYFADHADRALEAAQMLVDSVAAGDTGLRLATGVNSGLVVAGPLGGGGRLNFSVIGDVVNVAARVEAATRQTGDDVLITAETCQRLRGRHDLVSRGTIPLKGREEPMEVFAPAPGAVPPSSWSEAARGPRTHRAR